MNLFVFGDYELALSESIVEVLGSIDVEATGVAGALPADLTADTVQVTSLGGSKDNPGVLLPVVQVNAYAASEEGARLLGQQVEAALTVLDSQQIDTHATIVGIDPKNIPYPNHDPRNENLFRVSQTVGLTVKARPL